MRGKPWTPETRTCVRVLWENGVSVSNIAILTKVPRTTVYGMLMSTETEQEESTKMTSELVTHRCGHKVMHTSAEPEYAATWFAYLAQRPCACCEDTRTCAICGERFPRTKMYRATVDIYPAYEASGVYLPIPWHSRAWYLCATHKDVWDRRITGALEQEEA